jgi:hypothetical protein
MNCKKKFDLVIIQEDTHTEYTRKNYVKLILSISGMIVASPILVLNFFFKN